MGVHGPSARCERPSPNPTRSVWGEPLGYQPHFQNHLLQTDRHVQTHLAGDIEPMAPNRTSMAAMEWMNTPAATEPSLAATLLR